MAAEATKKVPHW